MSEETDAPKPKMDAADLWREEIFTDRKVGTIRRLVPVKADGSADPSRRTAFLGEAQILTTAGSLPLSFEIAAETLDQAVAGYAEAAQAAFDEAMEELKEMRRRASSSLVLPGGPGGLPPGAGLGGGLPPGGLPPGKLKL
ncbi:MAG: hypothetical protein KGM24_02105 [Elusimicrobia bacterium]|nr:hypothetical protein [Elusimicrobiota bacterium]